MSRFWSKNTHNLKPYTPGEQPQIQNQIKLNTNENPYGPSPRVLAAIAKATSSELRKYPDPTGVALKQVIADYYQLKPDQVFIGNSSDEVLAHTFRALFKHRHALLFPDITYSFYPVFCGLFEIDYQQIPLRDDFSIDVGDFNLDNGGIVFANPNAPTGIALGLGKIDSLLQTNTNSVVVVDEAYADFANESAISLISRYPNLLVTQTLSKSRSLAGLRVGFACGHADLIEALERVKNSFHPYALSTLALAGAIASFEDSEYFEENLKKVIKTRNEVSQNLQILGFEVLPSDANFVLTKHHSYPAAELFQALRQRNIIVRYFDAPRVRDYLRISIGSDADMHTLLVALARIIS